MAPDLPTPITPPACDYCDDDDTCGTGTPFHERLYRHFRETVAPVFDGREDWIAWAYLDQWGRQLYDQENALRAKFNYRPNELLVPLCAPRVLLKTRWHAIDRIIITSEVRTPTLRYRKDQNL